YFTSHRHPAPDTRHLERGPTAMRRTASKRYSVLSGIGAGAGAALAMMLVMGGLRWLVGLPTVPELMLNKLILLLGGRGFSDALEKLFYAGRPLLFTVILEGTLLLGALLGLLFAFLAHPSAKD